MMRLQGLLSEQQATHAAVLEAMQADWDKERRELKAARVHDSEKAEAASQRDRDEAKCDRDEAKEERKHLMSIIATLTAGESKPLCWCIS